MKFQNQGFDHVEFSVHQIEKCAPAFVSFGFEKIGERTSSGIRSQVFAQGKARIVLTEEPGRDFLQKHPDSISVLAVDVADANQAFQDAVQRGARPALEPRTFSAREGEVTKAEIWTPGDLRYRFISRKNPQGPQHPALFDENLVVSRLESPAPLGVQEIDHLTNCVGMGEGPAWVEWYREVFDFDVTHRFQIQNAQTGLISNVVQSKDRRLKIPINEGTEKKSQVQEYVDRVGGAGVQHLGLLTTDIMKAVSDLKKQNFRFMAVPHTYYAALPARVPDMQENLHALEELGILADGDESGYLMQIFGEEILGPFFFEFVERKGNKGFGDGNFQALCEALEMDQIRRGTL